MDEVERGGRALREAIQQYLKAIQSEPGHSWLSAAAHALEESTRKGYAAALRRLRKHSRQQFGASPRQVPELEIKEMVASENAEGNLKNLLSACRQLDKLRLHPRIVEAGDWQVVKWLAKRRVRGESALVRWAPMELFVWLTEQIVDLESAKIVALACISVACLLRVGGAATVRTSTRGDVRFNGEKGRPGIWDVEVGPWTKWWVLFLWEIRRVKHGRADLPFSFQDAAGLQAGWKKIVGGLDFEGYRWHALRRCGAAVLWGARIQTVMLAGGWVTPSVAKDYCHLTHAWSCERRMHLPVPVDWGGGGTSGAFQYRSEERPVDSMWPRWVRADLRDAAPHRCPGAQASAVGTKRRKRSKSLEPTSAARTEYDSESSSEGEFRFMECDP